MKIIIGAIIAFIIIVAAVMLWPKPTLEMAVTSFDECVAEGNPVMESYPRQCISKAGDSFTEVIPVATSTPNVNATTSTSTIAPTTPTKPVGTTPKPVAKTCYVGGCSSQLCSDQPGMVSTCEYRESYGCYSKTNAKCEQQANGQCGWTMTSALQMCLTTAQ